MNGTAVSGAVDTGAERSCVSPEFAAAHGLSPGQGTQHPVRLGNSRKVKSPGLVTVPWQFAGESQIHAIECAIIPGCPHPFILGAKFLRLTQTLTTFFKRRVKSTARAVRAVRDHLSHTLRLRLIGGEKQRVWGYLDGELASAVPDSGSDVMLLSRAYAQSRGLHINEAEQHRLKLQLGDGSYAWTSGLVTDLEWSFGDSGETLTSDFYVLDDLPVDIVFSGDFLFGHDVFSRFDKYFVLLDSGVDMAELYDVKLIGHFSDELLRLEEQYLNDCE